MGQRQFLIANQAPQRTLREGGGGNRYVPCAGSRSLAFENPEVPDRNIAAFL
jgi:hypothetical protein